MLTSARLELCRELVEQREHVAHVARLRQRQEQLHRGPQEGEDARRQALHHAMHKARHSTAQRAVQRQLTKHP